VHYRFCPRCGQRLDLDAPCRCQACGASYWNNPKPCADVLVTHEGRLLLVRRALEPWAGYWDIPGGFCEAGQHPAETAVREVREETGLDITLGPLLGMWLDRYVQADVVETTLNICYVGDVDDPSPARESAEVVALDWFRRDALPMRLAFPAHVRPAIAAWRALTPSR
jgi:8-oxo-dGTP diphosphatase